MIVEGFSFQHIPEGGWLVSLTSISVISTASQDDMILNWPVSPDLMVGPQIRKPFFPAHSSGAATCLLFQNPLLLLFSHWVCMVYLGTHYSDENLQLYLVH